MSLYPIPDHVSYMYIGMYQYSVFQDTYLNLSLIGCWWGTGQVTLLRWVTSLSVSACHEEYPVTSHTSYQNKDLTQIVSL